MRNRKSRYFILIIAIVGCLGFLYVARLAISGSSKKMDDALSYYQRPRFTLTDEEYNVVNPQFRSKLMANKIYLNKVRNPVALLFFDNTFDLISYKFTGKISGSVNEIVHMSTADASQPARVVYDIMDDNLYYRFLKKAGPEQTIKGLWITLYGNSIENPVLNDSIAYYRLTCKNLSIRYGDSLPIDIFVEEKTNLLGVKASISMELLIIRREGDTYITLMTPKSKEGSIPEGLLYNVVTGGPFLKKE
jgi:hypothetical protein